MCGIVGQVQVFGGVDRDNLLRMRDRLGYRGPDDAGVWVSGDGRIGLAHRRLSIVDLSAYGHQPMFSEDKRYCLIFNGEIYNHNELRMLLERSGFHFRGHSDSEVVLAAYEHWGEACLSHFNGMFALAIYDAGEGESPSPSLFLARDRAGKKPLYYHHASNEMQFASELKAIDVNDGMDSEALNYYLARGYVPHDLCLAAGVKKLPPAHAARLDIRSMSLNVWRYWSLPENIAQANATGEGLADQAESLLIDAVRLRMHCDVPVGVLLSGGLDSSLVVAAAARSQDRLVDTFTISLPGSRLDESGYAQCVADYYRTNHHVLHMDQCSLDVIEKIAPLVDEPIADSSLIPSYVVSGLTRKHVTVALGGDGGDELFGGYSDYPTSLRDQQRFGRVPLSIMQALGGLASMLPAGVKGRNRLASLRQGALQQMIWGTPYFDVSLRKRFLGAEARESIDTLDAPEQWLLDLYHQGRDAVDCMTRAHFNSILPDDFLVKVDRSSMYHSLELRSPFLDHRLIEFAFSSIPSHWKVQGIETRRIQQLLARRMLPDQLDTQRKQGFSVPLDDWLRQEKCATVRNYLDYLPDLINKREVEHMIAGHMKGRANGARLYALLMLAIAARNNGW